MRWPTCCTAPGRSRRPRSRGRRTNCGVSASWRTSCSRKRARSSGCRRTAVASYRATCSPRASKCVLPCRSWRTGSTISRPCAVNPPEPRDMCGWRATAGGGRVPPAAHEVNTTGTVNVLLAAGDAGVRRVVFAGSTSAYGNPADLPNHEDDRTHPLSPYAASKLAAEQYCQAFQATYGLEPVVLRYFNIFGPRQDPKSQYAAVIPRFITAALRGESPTIYGDGGQTRDFVYVANVVHANMLASRAPAAQVAGQVFNVGCGRAISVNGLWQGIGELVGTDVEPECGEARAGEGRGAPA